MENLYKSLIVDDRYLLILNGLKNTIIITIGAIIIGISIGLFITLIQHNYKENKKNRLLHYLTSLYVKVIRGTPVLLQLMIIYYIIFRTANINIILVGILAFGINSGAYVSEIFRAGIEAVDKGQMEAGKSLGLTYWETMRYIVLPQGFRISLPPLGNEFVTLIKETSVAGYIGIMELTKSGDIIASRTYNYFFPLIITALIYLGLTLGITRGLKFLEKGESNVRG